MSRIMRCDRCGAVESELRAVSQYVTVDVRAWRTRMDRDLCPRCVGELNDFLVKRDTLGPWAAKYEAEIQRLRDLLVEQARDDA